MNLRTKDVQRLIYAFIGIVLLLVATRLFAVARLFVLFTLMIALVVLTVYLSMNFIHNRRETKAYQKSIQGQIEGKLNNCTQELDKNKSEIETIRRNILDLEKQRSQTENISEQNKIETERLINGFQSELKLRETKISFYQTCVNKLKSILHNHLLAKELLDKESKLKKLQEDHYDDLARMEELKYDVEMDITYLDTIDNLSNQLNLSNSYEDVQRLNKELNEMTKGLNKL